MDTTLSVKATSTNGMRATVEAGGFSFIIDEPPAFLGTDTAPSPVLYLLASIAGCIQAAARISAKDMGLSVGRISVHVSGDTDDDRFFGRKTDVRSGFKSISARIEADTNENETTLNSWLSEIFLRCPVIDNILYETSIELTLNN